MNDVDLVTLVVVYADDILLTGNNVAELNDLNMFLDSMFKVKDLRHIILGMEILCEDSGIILSQCKFTLERLAEFGCLDLPPAFSPLDLSLKLHADEGFTLFDPTLHRRLLGKLNFLTHKLSQFMHDLCNTHFSSNKHCLHYLL